jgi:hypothetical protein
MSNTIHPIKMLKTFPVTLENPNIKLITSISHCTTDPSQYSKQKINEKEEKSERLKG